VTVFHAMWIPGLLFEDTEDTEKPSQTPENIGVLSRLSQGLRGQNRVIKLGHYVGAIFAARVRALKTGNEPATDCHPDRGFSSPKGMGSTVEGPAGAPGLRVFETWVSPRGPAPSRKKTENREPPTDNRFS
jgi:hypothetical protein